MEIFDRLNEIVANTDNPFVIEFGACDGWHSKKMLDIVSKKQGFLFHTFEPVPELCDQIRNNISQFVSYYPSSIKLFNEAIGSQTTDVKLYKSGGYRVENGQILDSYYGSSSIRKPKLVLDAWKQMTFSEINCKSTTFDNYINREGLNGRRIDFIWADIQGAEVDLILGGKETFKNVKYFYTEYCDAELYEGEIGFKEILNLLPDFEVVEDYKGDVLLKNKNL